MELKELLEKYPWQPEHIAHGEPLEWFWHFDLDASPQDLWPYLMETSKINREVGYGEAFYEERNGTLHGWMDDGKNRVEWVELPWSWNYAHSLDNVRIYSNGLFRVLRIHMEVGEQLPDGKVRYYLYLAVIPSRPAFARMIKPYYDDREANYRSALENFVRVVQSNKSREQAFTIRPAALADESRAYIEHIRHELLEFGQPADLVDLLLNYITTADELDLYRIRLVELARKWQVELYSLLSLALYAVRVGLLTLSWDVICPHCRNVRHEIASLSHLPVQGRCDVCGIDFSTADEDSLEITFHIHPAIIEVPRRYYCLGEASSKPHIKIQQRLYPGQQVELKTALPAGNYRLRVIGQPAVTPLVLEPSASAGSLRWEAAKTLSESTVKPFTTLMLVNPTDRMQVFVVEEPAWAQNVLRPRVLFNLQDFRDLFSYETLATDLYLDIGVQTIMFTDIVGSTRLYSDTGDARAFLLMKRHFETIFEVARRHRGAIVKTIGDGAMLSFPTSSQGLSAALELQKAFANHIPDSLPVRLSLHTGRCLAVNLNTGIDYFGQTVNIAAKLLGLLESGGIAITSDIKASADVEAALNRESLELCPRQMANPAFGKPVDAYLLKSVELAEVN